MTAVTGTVTGSGRAGLQVKTKTGGRGGWFMREKHERLVAPRFFYAFVDLEPESPVTYVVPSGVVADALRRHDVRPKDAVHVATAVDAGVEQFDTYDGDLIALRQGTGATL